MVQEGDAFMMFNVDDKCKLTYGIDFTYKSTAIGKQWESWTPTEDAPYVFHISPARTFGTINDFTAYFRAGYIKSGLEDCALIANGDQYWNAPVRVSNEPARHKLLDLIGDLSLLAEPGMSGVPVGHVVAYKAGHKLHAKFVKALAKASKEQVDAEIWSEGIDA
jgi:UDP-3-O-acyl-N-acetylglucosamine deacetylase